ASTNDGSSDGLGVGGRMSDNEILPSSLPDDAWIASIRVDARPDGLPHMLKSLRGAREMKAAEVGRCENRITDIGPTPRQHVDHAGWKTRLLEKTVDEVGGVE